MSSRLVNVRLDTEHARKARAIRASGVAISDLLRQAIDEHYEQLDKRRRPRDAKAIIKRLFAKYPDPPDQQTRNINVHDRHEMAAEMRRYFYAKHERDIAAMNPPAPKRRKAKSK